MGHRGSHCVHTRRHVVLTSARRCATIARIAARGSCNMGQRDLGRPMGNLCLSCVLGGYVLLRTLGYTSERRSSVDLCRVVKRVLVGHLLRLSRDRSVTGDNFPSPTVHVYVEPLLRHHAKAE